MTIAQFLPPVALKELAKACPSWRILCQMVFLDLRGNEKVAQWLYEMDGELREELFKHARKLSCHASNYPTPYDEDFEKFLMSHLPNFKCLSYLKIWSGEISSHLVHLQFSFASTLKVLELNRCHFSLGALVALLNQFDYLDHLILSWVILFPEDGEQAAQVSHHPKKLTVTECHGPHVLSELSALHLAYEELSFKIYSYCDKDMGLIEDSKASLTCLDLTCPGRMCHNNLTICLEITDQNPRFCFSLCSIPYTLWFQRVAVAHDKMAPSRGWPCRRNNFIDHLPEASGDNIQNFTS